MKKTITYRLMFNGAQVLEYISPPQTLDFIQRKIDAKESTTFNLPESPEHPEGRIVELWPVSLMKVNENVYDLIVTVPGATNE